MNRFLRELGEPDVTVGSLSIWIQGREFPEATDYWDGNWLRTVASFSAGGSIVTADGPFLRTPEILGFGDQCQKLHASLNGTASLDCIEPYLDVRLTGNGRGKISAVIVVIPDHLEQRHEFHEQIDQTHLPAVVAACNRLVARFPIVGLESKPAADLH